MITKAELEKENAKLQRRVANLEKQLARHKSGAATSNLKPTQVHQADQEVLQTSQDWFRELAEFMDEVLWVYDFDTRHITYINPAYERVWGRTVASLHQDPNTFLNSIHPNDRALVDQATIQQIHGERSAAEYRIIRPDGTMRWIWGRGFPVIVEGKCQRIIGIASDITAQKQAEADLLAHQENMHALLENTDASIWSIDTQYRMIVGNRLYHRNVSASIGRELKPGENVLALDLPQAAITEWRGYYDRALRGETFSIETTTRFAEHPQTIEYHFNPIKTDADQVVGVTVLGRNITERKHAEALHAKLIERLELATRSAQMGIWDWDIQNNVLVWDERMYELYGRSKDKFGGAYEAWLNGVHPDDRAASDEVSVRARAGEIEYDTEYRVIWPDGSVHWLKANGDVFRDEHGTPIRMIGVNYDITERKQMDLVLRESEARYRLIAQNSSDVIWVMDPLTGKFTYVSPSVEKLRGYTPEEVMAQPASEALTPESFKVVGDLLSQNLPAFIAQGSGTRSFVTEVDQPRKDGSIVKTEVTTTYVFNEQGQVEIIGVSRDITERKHADESLRESEHRYHELVQNVNSAIIRWKRDGTITFFNEFAQSFFGYAPEEIIGKHVSILLPPTDSAGGDLAQLVDNVANHPEQFMNNVNENIRRNGQRVWMTWTNRALYDENGRPDEILAVGSDVTELKHLQEELNHTIEDLQRANKELEQFAYVASHDLQEPLRAVAGMVQLLQKRYAGQLDAQADEYIHHAVDAAARMRTLINDLLTFSRVGTRGKPFEPTDMNGVLDLTLRDLNVTIQENHAIITHDDLPTVMGDSTQLGQLVQNLIGNAIKFHGDQPPQIHIGVQALPDAWQFAVRDNGIGIKPENFERIFIVFQRLHTRRAYPGTGIGLALCKKIVERHGGNIWVESEIRQGSTFYFTLPKA